MLFHISIAAERPEQAARLVAELWGGRAYPFPPVAEGSWIAMAGDDRGSAIEVYPLGTELHQGEGESAVRPVAGLLSRNGPVHVAVATELDVDEVKAIADRFGAPAKICSRGSFHVIELWVEGSFLIEVLTPQMQAEYLGSFNFTGTVYDFRAVGGGPRVENVYCPGFRRRNGDVGPIVRPLRVQPSRGTAMSKVAFAAVLSVLLLAACGSREQESAQNAALDAEANALGNASPSEPGQPDSTADNSVEPVPPPDAVSHPDGYLPPAPDVGPTSLNSSGSDESPPATEDEYIRNKQAGL